MEPCFLVLKSPGPVIINFGPFILRWYGLLIAISVFIGLHLSNKLSIKKGFEQGLITDLLPLLVLTSVIGARIYYVIFEWRNYSGENFWTSLYFLNVKISFPSFLAIWNGGIAIHGALIAGTLSVMYFCKRRNLHFWDLLDVILPSVSLGQAIGRWGNFFNNEAFGLPTNLPWKLYIPSLYRPDIFANELYFHPTFLYESIWNIGLFLLLIYLLRLNFRNLIKLPSGSLSCIYLIGYSLGRIWIEGLRTDPLCIGAMPPFCEGGIRTAQLISLISLCMGSLGIYWIYKKKRTMPSINKFNYKKR